MKISEIFGGGGVPDYKTMPAYKLKKKKVGKHKFFVPSNEPTPKGVSALENFVEPKFDVEWEEANRYPFLNKLGKDGWIELAQSGKVANVNSDTVKKIGNTGADGSEDFDDLEADKVERIRQAMKSGNVEMPIVMKMPNGKLELIAGNTRLIGLIDAKGKAKVWYIDASNNRRSDIQKQFEEKNQAKTSTQKVIQAGKYCYDNINRHTFTASANVGITS